MVALEKSFCHQSKFVIILNSGTTFITRDVIPLMD